MPFNIFFILVTNVSYIYALCRCNDRAKWLNGDAQILKNMVIQNVLFLRIDTECFEELLSIVESPSSGDYETWRLSSTQLSSRTSKYRTRSSAISEKPRNASCYIEIFRRKIWHLTTKRRSDVTSWRFMYTVSNLNDTERRAVSLRRLSLS